MQEICQDVLEEAQITKQNLCEEMSQQRQAIGNTVYVQHNVRFDWSGNWTPPKHPV